MSTTLIDPTVDHVATDTAQAPVVHFASGPVTVTEGEVVSCFGAWNPGNPGMGALVVKSGDETLPAYMDTNMRFCAFVSTAGRGGDVIAVVATVKNNEYEASASDVLVITVLPAAASSEPDAA